MGTVGAISRLGSAAPAAAVPDLIRWDDPMLVPAGICPGSVANIGLEDGQNHFLVQTAQDLAAAFEQHSQVELARGFDLPPYVAVSPDRTAVQSRVSVGAPTTGGSLYPRTEYREVGLDGLPIGFDALTGIHRLIFDFRILNTPTVGRDIVVGQLHNGDTDRLAIRAQDVSTTRRGRVRANGTSVYEFANPLVLGTWYRCMLEIVNNTANVYFAADGAAFPGSPQYSLASAFTATAGGATWYFKWGAYLQTNTGTDAATDYGLVEHRNISHWHTGWPTPAKYYAVPQHAATHAPGGQDDLSGTFLARTQVGVAGGAGSLDVAGRQPLVEQPLVSNPVRAGSVSSALTSDAGSGSGNLINLALTGSPTIDLSNPVDHQVITYHMVAVGQARAVTFGTSILVPPGLRKAYTVPRGSVLIATVEYIGNRATVADAAAPAWILTRAFVTDPTAGAAGFGPTMLQVRATANQAVTAASTWTSVTWPSQEDIDTDATHDLVTNNSRVTPPAGWYAVSAMAIWLTGQGTTGPARNIRLAKNGTQIPGSQVIGIYPNGGYWTQGITPLLVYLNGTDYIELQFQAGLAAGSLFGSATDGATLTLIQERAGAQ